MYIRRSGREADDDGDDDVDDDVDDEDVVDDVLDPDEPVPDETCVGVDEIILLESECDAPVIFCPLFI